MLEIAPTSAASEDASSSGAAKEGGNRGGVFIGDIKLSNLKSALAQVSEGLSLFCHVLCLVVGMGSNGGGHGQFNEAMSCHEVHALLQDCLFDVDGLLMLSIRKKWGLK